MSRAPRVVLDTNDSFGVPFLQLAFAGTADYLAIGDQDLLTLTAATAPSLCGHLFRHRSTVSNARAHFRRSHGAATRYLVQRWPESGPYVVD